MTADTTNDTTLDDLLEELGRNAAWLAEQEAAVAAAKVHRSRLWRAAMEAGGTYRQIAEASRVDHTIPYYEMNGRKRKKLDATPQSPDGVGL